MEGIIAVTETMKSVNQNAKTVFAEMRRQVLLSCTSLPTFPSPSYIISSIRDKLRFILYIPLPFYLLLTSFLLFLSSLFSSLFQLNLLTEAEMVSKEKLKQQREELEQARAIFEAHKLRMEDVNRRQLTKGTEEGGRRAREKRKGEERKEERERDH